MKGKAGRSQSEAARLQVSTTGLVMPTPRPERSSPLPLSELTAREREVLKLLCENMSHKEIAMAFGLSIETVKSHLQRIYIKLGVSTKAEAMRIFNAE